MFLSLSDAGEDEKENAFGLARNDLDRRSTGASCRSSASRYGLFHTWPDKRRRSRSPIRSSAVDRLEADLLRYAGDSDPARPLPHRCLVPTRILSVVAAHVKPAIDHDRPYPRRGSVRLPVLAERRDVQVIRLSDLAQFIFRPGALPAPCISLTFPFAVPVRSSSAPTSQTSVPRAEPTE